MPAPAAADPHAIAAAMRPMLAPRSVVIIGASDDPKRIGGRALASYLAGPFAGPVFPVNPRRATVQGRPAVPSIDAVPEAVEFALIAIPAAEVPEALRGCAAKGVRAAVILSAGFAEASAEGRALQDQVVAIAQATGMRICGPNCLGLFNAGIGHCPSFSSFLDAGPPMSGPVGLVTQSGASGTHLLHLAQARGVACKVWASTGNSCDVEVADLIIALALDPAIRVIGCYVEGIRDGDKFVTALATARQAHKPLIVIKAGASAPGAVAAQTHTGALAISDRVFSALLAQYGAERVDSMERLIDALYACQRGLFPAENGARVVTISGGAGVLMADAAAQAGLALPELPAAQQAAVAAVLPFAGTRNPVDLTGHVMNIPERIGELLGTVVGDGFTGPLVAYFMNWAKDSALGAPLLVALRDFAAGRRDQLLVACLIAPPDVRAAYEAAGYLVFEDPSRAIQAVALLTRLGRAFASAEADAGGPAPEMPPLPAEALNEHAVKALLARAGIRAPRERHCADPEAAVAAAEAIGFPVALKVSSPDLLHKADGGGVALDLADAAAVRSAAVAMLRDVARKAPRARVDGLLVSEMLHGGVEVILGAQRDPTFGPMLLFGLGGLFVELFEDVRLARPPVDAAQARAMVEAIRGYPLLAGLRGAPPADIDALVDAITRFSALVAANAERLDSLEINPLLVRPRGPDGNGGVVALDAAYTPRAADSC